MKTLVKTFMMMALILAGALHSKAASLVIPAAPLIRGTVTEIKGKRITVLRSIDLDVTNATIQKRRKTAGLESIGVGSRITVTVAGTSKAAGGVLLAELVEIDGPDGQLTGTLEARADGTITVAGQKVRVDGDTYIGGFQDAVAVGALADLELDYPIAVDVIATDKGLQATAVMAIGPTPAPPPIVPSTYTTLTGVVEAIGERAWTVAGTKVFVTAKTKIPVQLAVGETAIVAGVKQADGSIVADTIRRK